MAKTPIPQELARVSLLAAHEHLREKRRYLAGVQAIKSRYFAAIYSCFEKGCLPNGEKLTRQCRKSLWVMVVFTVACFYGCLQRGGMKLHKHVFVLSRSLLLNRLEPQSSKARLLLPIMPIGIVAYAFTLSWDNLCRNSCIQSTGNTYILSSPFFLDITRGVLRCLLWGQKPCGGNYLEGLFCR